MRRSTVMLALSLASLAAAGALAAARPDGAVIRNTGSTNFSGYTIKVWSDGRTSALRTTRSGQPLEQPAAATLPKAVAAQFFRDVRTARRERAIGQPCAKSASFGTATVVEYHGWTSPDLECRGDGLVIALGSDVKKIVAALRIQPMQSHRIPMLPNEPRRAEPSPSQASPTPEPSSPAS